ncbi:EamA family transporter [Pseudomonas putida]|nr:EamA family transporter [Pseudomonas putida]
MHRKHMILAVLVTALWGLNFPLTKLGLAHIDPLLLTGLRFALCALPWVFFVKRPKVAVHWLAAYGLIFGVAMWALINLGIAMGVPAGSASLLIQFSAFFTLAWGCLLFREPLTGTQLVGIALAATGLVGILAVSPGKTTTTGLLLLLISALAWSIGNVIIKLSKVKEIFAFVIWASLFAPIPLLSLAWWLHGTAAFVALAAQANAVVVFCLLFQVYAATHFCYWGWNYLLREYPVSRVAPLSLLIPVFGIASSALIVDEVPSGWEWLCIALILSALAVGMKPGRAVLGRKPVAAVH